MFLSNYIKFLFLTFEKKNYVLNLATVLTVVWSLNSNRNDTQFSEYHLCPD